MLKETLLGLYKELREKQVHVRLGEDVKYWIAGNLEKRLGDCRVEIMSVLLDITPTISGLVFRNGSIYHFELIDTGISVTVKITHYIRRSSELYHVSTS